MTDRGCCGPGRGDATVVPGTIGLASDDPPRPPPGAKRYDETVALPWGEFLMGTDDTASFPDDGEGPVRRVRLSPFRIDRHCVSNAAFADFVDATGYVTEAERIGWSYVFASFLPSALRRVSPRPDVTPWWAAVRGATWSAPEGPGSSVAGRWDHPVVHVTWNDAAAFATWRGARLPTEAEWEYAARGGHEQWRFPWGDELTPEGVHQANIWQGRFPTRNTREDGYAGTAPVHAFAPNDFGLYNTSGNVWEWCADWFGTEHAADGASDPVGPSFGVARVMRGGSYLCHDSYCNRYRIAARTRNEPDASGGNTGFRCAWQSANPERPA